MLDGNMSEEKNTSNNEFTFHLIKVLQNMLYFSWNLKL